MAGYLDYKRKVDKARSDSYINQAGQSFNMYNSPGYSAPKQLVYPQDLFSNDSLPFVLFFAVDPVTPSVLLDKIALYMPRELQVNYSLNYGEATNLVDYISENDVTGTSTMLNWISGGAAGLSGGAAYLAARALGASRWGRLGATALGALSGAAATVSNSNSIGQTSNIENKILLNPHKAALFEGVNFRRHSFQFELIARNVQESDTINEIVQTFKLHAHPEAGNANDPSSFFKWPSAWQIGLYSPARKYLYAISTSHITNIHVNYSSGGMRSFFSETGAPVAVRLNLEFMETEQLTRERIRQGY